MHKTLSIVCNAFARLGVFAIGCLLVVAAIAISNSANAAQINGPINWQAPTQNVDGSPLTDLDGYRMYFGLASRNYTDSVPIPDETQTSISNVTVALPFPGLGEHTVFVAMTAYDAEGNESAYSNEVTFRVLIVDGVAPNAPVLLQLDIGITIQLDVSDCPPQYQSCTITVIQE